MCLLYYLSVTFDGHQSEFVACLTSRPERVPIIPDNCTAMSYNFANNFNEPTFVVHLCEYV